MQFKIGAKLFSTAIILCCLLSGCGGGGGGGGENSLSVMTTSGQNSSITQSQTAANFIARQIAEPYANVGNYSMPFNRRFAGSLKLATLVQHGIGTARISYDSRDTVYLWGTKYTYYSGFQDFTARDVFGNLSGDDNLIDSLQITSINMGCEILDSGNLLNITYNGTLTLSGLQNQSQTTIQANNLNMSGTINNTDRINWTINGLVTINQQTYPYPTNGSNESGTLVFNNTTYTYSTAYNGTNLASVRLSGNENLDMTINLATGAVVKIDQKGTGNETQNLIGSWKMVAEDRDAQMLTVKPNDAGKVSMIHFYDNGTFRSESIERYSNSSIDFWQTHNQPAQIITGTYSLSGQTLTLVAGGETVQHTIIADSNQFHQINQFQEKFTWQKV